MDLEFAAEDFERLAVTIGNHCRKLAQLTVLLDWARNQ